MDPSDIKLEQQHGVAVWYKGISLRMTVYCCRLLRWPSQDRNEEDDDDVEMIYRKTGFESADEMMMAEV